MTPGTYNLSVYRGDTHTWDFVLWADTEKTIPIDLTSTDVAAEIRSATGATPVTVLAVTVTLPNSIHVELSPAQSRALPASARWDLQLTDTSVGRIATLLAGQVKVTGDITESDPIAPPGLLGARRAGYLVGEPI